MAGAHPWTSNAIKELDPKKVAGSGGERWCQASERALVEGGAGSARERLKRQKFLQDENRRVWFFAWVGGMLEEVAASCFGGGLGEGDLVDPK